MRSRLRGIGAVTIAAPALALLAPARAVAAPSARLTYVREQGAERCPDEDGLRRAVAARLGYDPFFVWAKVTVVAHVRRDAGGYRAEVTLVDDTGVSRGTRAITARGDDCAPLVGALALSISLALDTLSLPGHETPAPPREPPSPEPPKPEPPAIPPSPEPRAKDEPTPDRALAAPSPWRGWVGVAATGSDGVTPSVAFGGLARLRVVYARLSFGVEAGADLPTSASALAGGAITAWSARATAFACGHVSIVVGCGFVSGGPLVAAGEGLTTTHHAVIGFGAAGPRIGVEWPLSARFAFEAFAEVGFLFARRALQVGGADAFRQPIAAPRLGLGIATRAF